MSKVHIYFYPVWIRIWHITNALLCLALILTGVSMQYSSPDYPIIRFDIAVTVHNITGIALTVGYICYIIGNLTTGNGKYYKAKFNKLIKETMIQFKYYSFGIFKGQKTPFPINEKRKFNPLQKSSYILIMYIFMPILFISGWALLYPEIIIHDFFNLSGLHLTALFHILSGFIISVFMFVHIYFCTMGTTTTSNFKAMIDGWHK